jgi:hypothetical protein
MLSNLSTEEKIEIIMRQTDYNLETATEKLIEFNNEHLKVIKNYFGINDNKEYKIKSTNQEIYKQIRTKLDTSMREYNERKEKEEGYKQ